MKNLCFIFSVLAILSGASCSKKIVPTAEVNYLGSANGVLTLRSIGYCQLNNYRDECLDAAQENAFRTLFYRGIPGSHQNAPLITIDEKGNEVNSKFIKDFFETKRYKTFITASTPVSDIVKERKQKKITVDLSINLTSLRKELEHDKIVPKFGY